MKGWKLWAAAVFFGWVVPWVGVSLAFGYGEVPQEQIPAETAPVETTQAPVREVQRISVLHGEQVLSMDIDAYLTGVLLGEIPGSFSMEAKKAQAVVARTYTLRTVSASAKHPGMICTDSTCCQAYCDPEGFAGTQTLAEAVEAVSSTENYVLTYQGALIDATYFSCSGGQTEDAVAVWGSDIPYLQSVDSPGEEQAAHYSDSVRFTPEAFAAALGRKLTGNPGTWFGSVTYTEGGGVATMVIGGREYKGTQLRQLLGLRSTAFTVEAKQESITVTTKGFGHRVGMSQYGAQAMALAGSSYEAILAHYYQGTALTQWNWDK